MIASRKPDKDPVWQKTPYVNLIRYKPSQVYFARFRVKGKLIRRSLKTNHLSVAKLRLADFEKSEQQKARSTNAVAAGKMTFGDALAVFKTRVENNPALKPRTKEYCAYRISALLKSWPGLAEKDVSRISNTDCFDRSVKNASKNSSSSHNYTVSILRRVFAIAIESGARYDNPALSAKRVKQRTRKHIELPEYGQFEKLVTEVRASGSGYAPTAAELVQFLAFGGLRIGEAKFVAWADCDFKRGEIIVRGHPEGATLYTDGWVAYRGLAAQFNHSTVDHMAKEYVNGDCHTNGIESFWALFKRGYHGVYHHMSRKHMQRYVNEFTFRFNRRANLMQSVFSDVIARVAESTKLPYKTLIQKPI